MPVAIVGDIHGDARALETVLTEVSDAVDSRTPVVFLGDYIDGAPDSKGVIDLLISFREARSGETRFLMGNHEQWLLASLDDHTKHSWLLSMKGLTTVASYSPEFDAELRDTMKRTGPDLITEHKPLPYDRLEQLMPGPHLSFFRSLELFYDCEECLCTHAGVSKGFTDVHLETPRSLLWGSDEFPSYYTGERLIVYGHFSKKAIIADGRVVPFDTGNTICLDTTGHGVVTAVILPERLFIQSEPLLG